MVDHTHALKPSDCVNNPQRRTIATIESVAGKGVNALAPSAFQRDNMLLVFIRQLLAQLLPQAENLVVAGVVVYMALHTGHLHKAFHEVAIEAILCYPIPTEEQLEAREQARFKPIVGGVFAILPIALFHRLQLLHLLGTEHFGQLQSCRIILALFRCE